MKTTILVGGAQATVERGRWTTAAPWLARVLPLVPLDAAGYVPDADRALAEAAIGRLGGRIIAYAGPPQTPPGAEA